MGEYRVDPRDGHTIQCAAGVVLPGAVSLTVYMCWHSGVGHGYPADVLAAARRLRERHASGPASSCDDVYTSLTFAPSPQDCDDFLVIAPFCDLAYAADPSGGAPYGRLEATAWLM